MEAPGQERAYIVANIANPKRRYDNSEQGRRDEVALATSNVIARVGLEGTSMREISQEMGVSTGVLTYHFRNKGELLDFVFDNMVELLEERRHFEIFETVEAFRDALLASMPSTEELRRWWKVWLAFTTGAYSRPAQRMRQIDLSNRVNATWKASLERLRDLGLLRSDIDIDHETATLGYLFDGMGINGVYYPDLPATEHHKAVIEAFFFRLRA